jgi:hypothetical protein
MMSKAKLALIAAIAIASTASPVLAQTYVPRERSGPIYNYSPGDPGYSNYYNFYDGGQGSQGFGSNNCGISC